MSARWDVLVVGGGPAGSATATLAASSGLRVCLLEGARFPRDKVCGEFVAAEGCAVLRRLGVLPALVARGASSIDACRVTDPCGADVSAALPALDGDERRGLGVSRELLDSTLLERASAAGVEVRQPCEALEPWYVGGVVCGVRARGSGAAGRVDELRASVVVAADGRRSTLARAIRPHRGDPLRTGPRSWFGMKTHLRGEPARLAGRVELHTFRGGYAGLLVVEDGRINVCLLTRVAALRDCGGSPARLLGERVLQNPAARDRIGDAEPCGRWHAIGPLAWGVRRPAGPGVLFVGDAAGTVDPFTGEGMSHALGAAELAAPFVLRAAAAGAVDLALGRDYAAAWRSAFGPVTRRARRLGFLLERRTLARPALRLLAAAPETVVRALVAGTRTGARSRG